MPSRTGSSSRSHTLTTCCQMFCSRLLRRIVQPKLLLKQLSTRCKVRRTRGAVLCVQSLSPVSHPLTDIVPIVVCRGSSMQSRGIVVIDAQNICAQESEHPRCMPRYDAQSGDRRATGGMRDICWISKAGRPRQFGHLCLQDIIVLTRTPATCR